MIILLYLQKQLSMKIRTHIKDSKKAEEYCCNICLDICIKPTKCAGPCKALFCMRCISEWSKEHDQCPLKCTNQLLKIVPIQNCTLGFYCPYNKNKCIIEINTVEDFLEHYKVCKEMSQEQLKEIKYKNEFKCNLSHKLEFYISQTLQMLYLQCQNCQQIKSCRATCRQCSQFYCLDCRKPPFSKNSCPLGHKFKFHKKSPQYMCSACDCPLHLLDYGLYQDQLCNFGLCKNCYKNAPEQLQYTVIQNNSELCKNKHKLTFVKELQLKKCQSCKKQVLCSKYCEQCKQNYCLQCKLPKIMKNEKCPLNHKFLSQQSVNNQKFCMKCLSKQPQQFHYDHICNVRLCNYCFQYLQKLRLSKPRFTHYEFCPKGHCMHFLIADHTKARCNICGDKKYTKIFCGNCSYFCCLKCLPPKISKQCYFGHELSLDQIPECLICEKSQPEIMGWKCDNEIVDCDYMICEQCKNQLQQNNKKVQKSQPVIQ